MIKTVPHISGGTAIIDMTPAERERCDKWCAEHGDPPCYALPQITSDSPRRIGPCPDCRDPGREGVKP